MLLNVPRVETDREEIVMMTIESNICVNTEEYGMSMGTSIQGVIMETGNRA